MDLSKDDVIDRLLDTNARLREMCKTTGVAAVAFAVLVLIVSCSLVLVVGQRDREIKELKARLAVYETMTEESK